MAVPAVVDSEGRIDVQLLCQCVMPGRGFIHAFAPSESREHYRTWLDGVIVVLMNSYGSLRFGRFCLRDSRETDIIDFPWNHATHSQRHPILLNDIWPFSPGAALGDRRVPVGREGICPNTDQDDLDCIMQLTCMFLDDSSLDELFRVFRRSRDTLRSFIDRADPITVPPVSPVPEQ